jgi:hypothetical protein
MEDYSVNKCEISSRNHKKVEDANND